jgi:outer membrane lipoprotein LolB
LKKNNRALAALWKPHWLFSLLLVLSACTGFAVKETGPGNRAAYQDRAVVLAAIPEWGFVGRISLDDGDRGGSGRLQWDVEPGKSEIDFHAAMGRGAWHLEIGPEGAVLKEADGSEQSAPGVNTLIQDRMGWPIPVDALQWWVRGLAAPGAIENEKFDSEGLLISLGQFGWSVDFKRYASTAGAQLPVRLNASRENYRVKLAISRWRMNVSHASAN